MRTKLFFSTLCILGLGCQSANNLTPKFYHDISEGPRPWTSETFEPEEEDFTFAIISDLTGGERPNIYSTAVGQLNRLDPTFVLSVGDLIEGGTEDVNQLEKEWNSFDTRTAGLAMPFFHLGGNHDLTNPVMRRFWENRFGRRYYHFVYENVLFLMLDSEDYEEQRMVEIYQARAKALKILSGEIEGKYEDSEYFKMPERNLGGISDAQNEYFKTILEHYPKVKWTFVFMHKPLWMHQENQGLEKLEALLANRPYTVFNGHVHAYSHRIRNGRDYIMLGTTGGSQNPKDSMAFDHVTLVRMAKEPVITTLKMEGILDETGKVKVEYDSLILKNKSF